MDMRAMEDIAMAQDLTPPLPPLAFCLHDSFLSTHCSACALPLPSSPFFPTLPPNYSGHAHSLLYCSPHCSAVDSHLHLSSCEHNLLRQSPSSGCLPDSSNIRLALRLLNLFFRSTNEAVDLIRIGGLVTNYEKFVSGGGNGDVGEDVLGMIKEGAARMVLAGNFGDDVAAVAEAVMCLVLTNAVEVQDTNGTNVGIAVYGGTFSWINHGCSPNACYRFTAMAAETDGDTRLRIYPAAMDGGGGGATAGAAGDWTRIEGCGPRIIVRSIKGIKKDEEVTISYTDLLQPKELRQSELHAKYHFNCCCKRCRAIPLTYVDHALQAILVCSPDGHNLIFDDDFNKSSEAQTLIDTFDDALDEYLRFNHPETCCMKLDELLTHGYLDKQQTPNLEKSQSCIRLHQLHYLSLNAYTTLASAYRVCAGDLVAFTPVNHEHRGEAFNMSRISAAYSLLLAAVAHHLFLAESSLIASVANYWRSAGESLVSLSRSSKLDMFQKSQPSISENWFGRNHKCYQIVQLDGFNEKYFTGEMFAEISREFLSCIVNLAEKVWNFLTQGGHHLNEIKNLIDFRGLLMAESSPDLETRLICNCHGSVPRFEGNEHTSHDSMHLFHLGVHCLIYGVYLSILCFGKQSYLASDVVNFLYNEGIFSG